MTKQINKDTYETYFSPCLAKSTDLVIERAQGAYIYTPDGEQYLDLVQGIAVNALGHSDPGVLAAAKGQIDKIVHGSFNLVSFPSTLEMASKLARVTPDGLDMFFLTNSGAEAVEGCMKLARYVTGRTSYLAFKGGFHGRTMGAASITTSSVKFREHYAPFVPQVYFADYPYCYRCPYGCQEASCSLECLAALKENTKTIIPADEIACAIFEPVMGEGGYVVPPKKYLVALREFCDEHGILLVFDEVQTGVGRTGRFFASQHFGVTPDVMSMGKAVGGGFPLGIVVSTKELMNRWSAGAHGTTFGGHPVAAAAAMEVIARVSAPGFLDRVGEMGEYFRAGLSKLQKKDSRIGDVRGVGLMNAMELVGEGKKPDAQLAGAIFNGLKERKILALPCGPDKNVIRFIPPLNVEIELLDHCLAVLEEVLDSLN
ncbi:MAG: aminotransferase class III-fold pyridoxal phosphate-dependent enzyme [Deltaproteobacteria bacterium]|nr:aminotransferase class III-fold pyridoxal phosphate-dependent enzyme [Deltaproteobacteria bacterium]